MKRIILTVTFCIAATFLYADYFTHLFKLPAIISDHAVLQQSANVKLWGWAPASARLKIICSWRPGDTIYTTSHVDFSWSVTVKTPSAGGKHNIQFLCEQARMQPAKIIVNDIIFGEVWICSGQSNMGVNMIEKNSVSDAENVLETCKNDDIRFFVVVENYNKFPQTDCKGVWQICDSATLRPFSAIGYFFGREINKHLKTPVGLIGSYWGGTSVQPWTPKEAYDSDPGMLKFEKSIEATPWAPQYLGYIYNSMIYPLAPYRVAGVLWYQGETNALSPTYRKEPDSYGMYLASMIKGWRKIFEYDFPFYFVQVPPYSDYPDNNGAFVREQQELTLSVQKTGMISVGDQVDDIRNIHPRKKAVVGRRLANIVLKEQYNFKNIFPYSPKFESMSSRKNEIRIKVASIGILKCMAEKITGFEVAGKDSVFYTANAVIAKNGVITITSSKVTEPVAVRYCFRDDQIPNLFDVNDLPLLPFRTDRW